MFSSLRRFRPFIYWNPFLSVWPFFRGKGNCNGGGSSSRFVTTLFLPPNLAVEFPLPVAAVTNLNFLPSNSKNLSQRPFVTGNDPSSLLQFLAPPLLLLLWEVSAFIIVLIFFFYVVLNSHNERADNESFFTLDDGSSGRQLLPRSDVLRLSDAFSSRGLIVFLQLFRALKYDVTNGSNALKIVTNLPLFARCNAGKERARPKVGIRSPKQTWLFRRRAVMVAVPPPPPPCLRNSTSKSV